MNQFKCDDYLASLNIDVMHFGLEAITELMARFGNPQNSYPTILIGGTNGKGSTAAMAASVLREAGFKTGLYTSPHLVDVRERIVINGKKISQRKFGCLLQEIKSRASAPLTYFEVITAAALIHFEQEQVDIAFMEVGLGGRLDATNVCRPLISVITNIGLEHTAYLGDTLEAIAGEKAGIIKPGGVCITGATQKKVISALASVCRQQKSRFYRQDIDFRMIRRANGLSDYLGMNRNLYDLDISLPGRHQLANAALALALVEMLEQSGFHVKDDAVLAGLKKTRWPARMEIICQKPVFLLDGAHNPAGMRVLSSALRNDFAQRRLILIFAVLADKDYRRMLQRIAPLADRIFLPPLKTKRAVAPQVLAAFIESLGYPALMPENVTVSVMQALQCAVKDDLICACGSLYLAGEVKQIFSEIICCDKRPTTK